MNECVKRVVKIKPGNYVKGNEFKERVETASKIRKVKARREPVLVFFKICTFR